MSTLEIKPQAPAEEKPLPMFREDLRMYPGPVDSDGSPTYSLFDPVKGQYYRITWTEYLVFIWLRPGMTMTALIDEMHRRSTVKVTKEELDSFFQDALAHNLLKIAHSSETVQKRADALKTGVFKWLLYHYLYIRIPLLNPDKFLERTLEYVLPLVSKPALYFYFAVTLIGLFQLITRFEEFIHTFPYFFTFSGAIAYGLGITGVKILHEFAHAYTARYYKLYIPTMGVALIVFWPVLYTDVTDGWKLAKRSQRLAISFAGIAVELVIAGIATMGWVLTSPGPLQSLFFVIASVTWVSTLAVNLNPAMRFDGYYILSDLWGMDNLQARAFAVTRWQFRKWVLGLDMPPPESNLSRQKELGLIVYSFYTWIYRLVLYIGIALLVYHQFTKALGVLLFILEIAVFIIWPVVWEVEQIYKLREFMTINRRSLTTAIIAAILAFWFIVPYPHLEDFPSVVIPNSNSSQVIYVPYQSTITKLYVKRGDEVKAGQVLAELSSPELQVEIAKNELEKLAADQEILIAQQLKEFRSQMGEKKANVNELAERVEGLKKLEKQLKIVAEVDGTIFNWDENLREGLTLGKDQVLGKIADLKSLNVIGFVAETQIGTVYEGQSATFIRKHDLAKFKGRVIKVNPVRVSQLIYPQLASINHGDLAVSDQVNKQEPLKLVDSYYNIFVALDPYEEQEKTAPLSVGEMGEVEVRGPWRSKFMVLWRQFQSIFWREGSL